jgi:hypothetical protein
MTDSVVSVVCRRNHNKALKLWEFQPEWAAIAGFGDTCVQWLAKDAYGAGSSETWERLNTQPLLNEVYTLRVSTPFTATSAQPFWVLYQPALTSINGWGDPPEEIPLCCLVQAVLLDVIEYGKGQYGGDYAWITVQIQQVVPLNEIVQRFPPNSSGEACRMVQQNLSQSYERVEWEDWTIISVSAQGNVGGWIVTRHYNGSQTIVLYCDWWIDEDDLYAGNRPLTEEEWAQLTAR